MHNSTQHSIEAITIATGNKTTTAGVVTAVSAGAADKVGILDLTNAAGNLDVAGMCAIGGLLLALLGFLTSLYFQWRRDRRESLSLEFARRMAGSE